MSLLDLFRREPEQKPAGDYVLRFRDQFYTGRAHNGEPILNPDPDMACRMSMEQAMYKRMSEPYFAEFSVEPMAGRAA